MPEGIGISFSPYVREPDPKTASLGNYTQAGIRNRARDFRSGSRPVRRSALSVARLLHEPKVPHAVKTPTNPIDTSLTASRTNRFDVKIAREKARAEMAKARAANKYLSDLTTNPYLTAEEKHDLLLNTYGQRSTEPLKNESANPQTSETAANSPMLFGLSGGTLLTLGAIALFFFFKKGGE